MKIKMSDKFPAAPTTEAASAGPEAVKAAKEAVKKDTKLKLKELIDTLGLEATFKDIANRLAKIFTDLAAGITGGAAAVAAATGVEAVKTAPTESKTLQGELTEMLNQDKELKVVVIQGVAPTSAVAVRGLKIKYVAALPNKVEKLSNESRKEFNDILTSTDKTAFKGDQKVVWEVMRKMKEVPAPGKTYDQAIEELKLDPADKLNVEEYKAVIMELTKSTGG
jgi:hypothetical protein